MNPTPTLRTLVHVYDGEALVKALFKGQTTKSLSELIPPPTEFTGLNDISWIHYELLFGDEKQALSMLDDYGLMPADVSAYKRQTDVRREAYEVMSVMATHGLVSLAAWRLKNWGGPDRVVQIHHEEPYLVLAIEGDASTAAINLFTPLKGVDCDIVTERMALHGAVECSRVPITGQSAKVPQAPAAALPEETRVRFSA